MCIRDRFTIGNFLSFKEQSTLSLVVSALKEIQVPAEDIIFSVGTAGLLLMKSAVVYGANASGKSLSLIHIFNCVTIGINI